MKPCHVNRRWTTPITVAGAEITAGQARRGGAKTFERPEDPARQEHRAGEREQGRDDRDHEDLRVVHVEHHEPRRDHDAQREANRQQRERSELEPQSRDEPHDEDRASAPREDADTECEREGGHARSR